MQLCDYHNLSKPYLNEFNEGASTTKLGRLFQVLVTLIVKLNLHRSYLGLWVSSLRSLPLYCSVFHNVRAVWVCCLVV